MTPPHGTLPRPVVHYSIYALLDDAMLEAIAFPKPLPGTRQLIRDALRLRGKLIRWTPPRRRPHCLHRRPQPHPSRRVRDRGAGARAAGRGGAPEVPLTKRLRPSPGRLQEDHDVHRDADGPLLGGVLVAEETAGLDAGASMVPGRQDEGEPVCTDSPGRNGIEPATSSGSRSRPHPRWGYHRRPRAGCP